MPGSAPYGRISKRSKETDPGGEYHVLREYYNSGSAVPALLVTQKVFQELLHGVRHRRKAVAVRRPDETSAHQHGRNGSKIELDVGPYPASMVAAAVAGLLLGAAFTLGF